MGEYADGRDFVVSPTGDIILGIVWHCNQYTDNFSYPITQTQDGCSGEGIPEVNYW